MGDERPGSIMTWVIKSEFRKVWNWPYTCLAGLEWPRWAMIQVCSLAIRILGIWNASLLHVEISCWNSRNTWEWIFHQPIVIESCFNSWNTLCVVSESSCNCKDTHTGQAMHGPTNWKVHCRILPVKVYCMNYMQFTVGRIRYGGK